MSFGTFTKRYFLDVVFKGSGLFEFKASEAIVPRHRAQTLHYLLVAGLGHAKLVNVRTELVEHEFVNCSLRRDELRNPVIQDAGWDPAVPGAVVFRETLRALIADWGAGLELALYDAALSHFLIGETDVSVQGSAGHLGVQRLRLAAPEVAFKLTALTERQDMFVVHARRLLEHTSLKAILWANVTLHEIRFTVVK